MNKKKLLTVGATVLTLLSTGMPVRAVADEATSTVEETGSQTENVALKTGDVITIEGKEYTIIEKVQGTQYKVLATDAFKKEFDINDSNNYATSSIATYLNGDYYDTLPENIKNAIVPASIQQKAVISVDMNDSYNLKVNFEEEIRTSMHKIFVPSWDEVAKVYGNSEEGLIKFHPDPDGPGYDTWFRDGWGFDGKYAFGSQQNGLFSRYNSVLNAHWIRPTMVLDINKVNYDLKYVAPKGTEEKSAELKYQVDVNYEWSIHPEINFGKNKGVNQSVSLNGNKVTVSKNVIEEGNKLVIKIKGGGENDAFTISNGKHEVLNYAVTKDGKELNSGAYVLEVPSGTNDVAANLDFILNTTNKKAEIAGNYNGQVSYAAEIVDINTQSPVDGKDIHLNIGDGVSIDNKNYFVIDCSDITKCKLLAGYPVAENQAWGSNNNRYKDSQLAKNLDTVYFENMTENVKKAIVETDVIQKTIIDMVNNNGAFEPIYNNETEESGPHKLFIPSHEEMITLIQTIENRGDEITDYFPLVPGLWTRDAFSELGGKTTAMGDVSSEETSANVHPELVINLKKVSNDALKILPGHKHSYVQKSDENSHWKECSDCDKKIEFGSHIASDWIIDTIATQTTAGSKHKQCKVCGRVLKTVEIPATGFIGYYADINGDGTVDGVIFADLGYSNYGQWGGSGTYSYSAIPADELKSYEISQDNYSGKFGDKPVLKATSNSGKDRFYVMALENIGSNKYTWYANAFVVNGNGLMTDYASTTSTNFGTGKQNTINMINKWNNKAYGNQTAKDLWNAIQEQTTNGWFVPSKMEWAAFGRNLGITKTNYGSFGLSDQCWSSSQNNRSIAYSANFYYGGTGGGGVNVFFYVRLATTF